MNIEPCGHRVLIDPEMPKESTEWGFKLDIGQDFQRERAATTKGVIVSIGSTAWKAFDSGDPWAKVGDKVYFAKYGGKFVKMNGKDYVVVNDEDVISIIHEDEEDTNAE